MVDGDEVEYFGGILAGKHLRILQSESAKNSASLEVLPVGTALELWRERVLHRRVFIFIDNDAARASWIKATSRAPSVALMTRRIVMMNAKWPCFTWYSRVPSASNPGDAPSRRKRLELARKNARQRTDGSL